MEDLRISKSFDDMISKARNKIKVVKMKILANTSSFEFDELSNVKKILDRAVSIIDIIDSHKQLIMSKLYDSYDSYNEFKNEFNISIINKGDENKLIIALSQLMDRSMMKKWWNDFNDMYKKINPEQKL